MLLGAERVSLILTGSIFSAISILLSRIVLFEGTILGVVTYWYKAEFWSVFNLFVELLARP